MGIQKRNNTKKAEIEARAIELLFELLRQEHKTTSFIKWGDDKTDADAYIALDGKTIAVEITTVLGESPTSMGKALKLEKHLIAKIKEIICNKLDWRGAVSLHLARHIVNKDDINTILDAVAQGTAGLQRDHALTIQLPQVGFLALHPASYEKKMVVSMIVMALCSDEANTPFIEAVKQAIDRKRHHKYGDQEAWLLCIDSSTVGLLVEDDEIKKVEGRIEELGTAHFNRIIVVQSTSCGARGMFSSHKKNKE